MSAWWQYRVVRHGLFWLAVLVVNFLVQLPAHFIVGTKIYGWGLIFNQLPACMLATYPLLYWVLPRLMRRQLLQFVGLLAVWFVASSVLANLTRAFYDFLVGPRLFGELPGRVFSWHEQRQLSYTFFVLLVTAGGACAIKVLNGWYEQRQLSQLLEQRRLHTELQLLKTQLRPDFLFDTLGALRQLTARKSPDSPAAVLHLSAVLRYMLYEAPQEAVPLADEVELLQHYVALEQLRLGSRVEVSWNVSGHLGAHTVAPLLLLPLVENAFRHGTGPELECPWVSIDLVARRHSLVLKVLNSQAPAAGAGGADWHEGAGLHCLRQRLARLYPTRHELKVLTEPDTFFVMLQLHLAPLPAPAGPVLLPA